MERNKIIIRTSIIGIAANVLLAAFKAAVGLLTHSVAVVLDAVNNLSDALSSLITIIGTKLAGKPADKQHPLGHGRVEYLSAMIIAVIVLYAGVTSLVESVKKILSPQTPAYTPVSLVIIAVAVAVKLLLGRYVKGIGEKVNSDSLTASGSDATLDAAISASTLAAALIYLASGVSLEAYLAAVISVVIVKSGYDMLRGTISEILGERADSGISKAIRKTVESFPEVNGAYDLILHNYGPDTLIGSVHIEIPDTMTADKIDTLEREIQAAVYEKHGVVMTGISIYSQNTTSDEYRALYDGIRRRVMAHEGVLQMHGFYLDREKMAVRFDVVLDFAAGDRRALCDEIRREISAAYPAYEIQIALDADISD